MGNPRTTRVAVLLLSVLGAAVLGGCAILASKGEYGAYREVRLAEGDQDRALAMQRYVSEYPTGSWATSIEQERVRMEPELWEANRSTRQGLLFYLSAYPNGSHAEEARPRLAALQTVQGRREEEEEAAREVERDRLAALAERRRTWMTRAAQFWTRTMIGISNWGSPIPDVARANPAFSQAFGNAPRPRCSREECIKFYRADFGIPVPGSTRLERSLELLLRLRMHDGQVRRAELLLPNKGFSRWYEQENRVPVIDEDPTQRQQAIEWALERILPAIQEVAPGAQVVDVVPEPIDPPTVLAPNQPDQGASLAPGDVAEEEETPATPEPAEGEPAQADPPVEQEGQPSQLDELLQQATGGDEQPAPVEPVAQPEPVGLPQADVMVLPIALQGFQAGNVRIVLFAAPAEDYGVAYDGLFIEMIEPEPEPEARPRRGRRR